MALDHTHDPAQQSWVGSANDPETDFSIQNLPLGVFSPAGEDPRCGIAIGDQILDLRTTAADGLLSPALSDAVAGAVLDPLLALGRGSLRALRHEVFTLLNSATGTPSRNLLHPMAACRLALPTTVRSFTDFYTGIYHAKRCSEIVGQAGNPLPPNFHHMPLGYNGRASTVRVSGEEVRRPLGLRKRLGETEPSFGASTWLDFELEIGFFIGSGNTIGRPLPISEAGDQVVGFCLLNDWSARDIQLFEMAPLGAFTSKSLSTTISPWMVTADAMEPFRSPAMDRFPDASPLPTYLNDPADQSRGGLQVALTATLVTEEMRSSGLSPVRLLQTEARHLYWTAAQMVTQQSITGCSLSPGDLIGTGTISGPNPATSACLFELSAAGREPISLPYGESRTFLEDGDEVSFFGRCERPGFASIGFGSCTGRVVSAPTPNRSGLRSIVEAA